jgi:hypothetical protein
MVCGPGVKAGEAGGAGVAADVGAGGGGPVRVGPGVVAGRRGAPFSSG